MKVHKWIWLVTLYFFIYNSALASPVLRSSGSNYDSSTGTLTLNGSLTWTNQPKSWDEYYKPMNISLILLMGTMGIKKTTGQLSVTCPAADDNFGKNYWYNCQKAWQSRYGSSQSYTVQIPNVQNSYWMGWCVSLGTINGRVEGAGCAGDIVSPPTLACKVVSGASPVFDFGPILAGTTNGSKRNQQINISCNLGSKPANADFSVKMSDWRLDLKNGSVAEFTLSANGNTLTKDGHLSETENGQLSISLDTALKGKPTTFGYFEASSVLTLDYE